MKVDNQSVISGVKFPEFSPYLPVESGPRNLKVLPTGSQTAVIDANVNVVADKRYSVIANDKVSSIEPLVLENLAAPSTANGCDVRVVHGAPSAPAVDVYATAPEGSLSNTTPVLSNVSFPTASNYLSVPCGTYRFRVTVAGTQTVAIDSGALTLNPNTVLTVIARDAVGGGAPFGLTVLKDNE